MEKIMEKIIFLAYDELMDLKEISKVLDVKFVDNVDFNANRLDFIEINGVSKLQISKDENSSIPVVLWEINKVDMTKVDSYYKNNIKFLYLEIELEDETIEGFYVKHIFENTLEKPTDEYLNKILDIYEDYGLDPTALENALDKVFK